MTDTLADCEEYGFEVIRDPETEKQVAIVSAIMDAVEIVNKKGNITDPGMFVKEINIVARDILEEEERGGTTGYVYQTMGQRLALTCMEDGEVITSGASEEEVRTAYREGYRDGRRDALSEAASAD